MQDHWIGLVFAATLFLIIVLVYTRSCIEPPKPEPTPVIAQTNPLVGKAQTWQDLSPDEKLDYLVTRYLDQNGTSKVDPRIAKENAYITSLPQSSDCTDDYDDCPAWAVSGECDINPEYMLYNCKKSCKSCALNPQQLENVTRIFNTRNPPSCAFHGNPYPGPFNYYFRLLEYAG
jgi:hypothetical protein